MSADRWEGCFKGSWKGYIVEEAFSHPAKFARGLVTRMVSHALSEGWVKPGGTVLDPFGGCATGGLICAYKRVNWIGVELEPHIYQWALANIEHHRMRLTGCKLPIPKIIHGDSRKLKRLLKEKTEVLISAPPALDLIKDLGKNEGTGAHGEKHRRGRRNATSDQEYGRSHGQLAEAVISSPPYAASISGKSKTEEEMDRETDKRQKAGFKRAKSLGKSQSQGYGTVPGQLSNMGIGDLDALISSPPYESSGGNPHLSGTEIRKSYGKGRIAEGRVPGKGEDGSTSSYGKETGQLGNVKGDTFWEAAREIVLNCHDLLRPGGHAVWNTKDFVRDGERVPFSDQWLKLCEACGFKLVCRHHAMLVQVSRRPSLTKGFVEKKKENTSFFRKLYHSRLPADDPRRIEWEDVICMRKV